MMGGTSTIFAAGVFGSLGMLAWGAAAVLPLLIHLWNRRQHRETPWAAMEFLLAAIQEQSKRMRIEQLLLLLLRVAIPIVFAMALADPLWQLLPTQGSSLGSRVPHHHLFVLDTSYSMGYEVDSQTRLTQAQEIVRNIVNESPQGDGFTLIRMSNPSDVVVGSPAYAKTDVLAELDGLTVRDYVADLATGLDFAKQTLQATRASHPRLVKHRVYVLSDMGRNTWLAADRPAVRKTIGEIESQAEVVIVDVGVEHTDSAGIVSAKRKAAIPIRGSTMSWNVAARAWGSSEVTSQEIEMRVNDRLANKQVVELGPNKSATATFSYPFDTSGTHVVSFHLPGDALSSDNQRYEVVTVRETINVLCVEGRPGAARNVALALAPSTQADIQIKTVRDHRVGSIDLKSYDAVFLCNIGRVTTQQATEFRDFLRLGRGIVMFLGDQTQMQNLNEMLGQAVDGQPRVLPTDLLVPSPSGRYPFSPIDYQHPLVEPFRGQEQAGLLSTPIWSYIRMKRPDSGTARVALEFTNGDPAIIEHSVFQGKFALVATAPSQRSVLPNAGRSTPWNGWSVWPSFPPIVQELLTYAVGGVDDSKNVIVGRSIGNSLPVNSVADFVTIQDNDRAEQRVGIHESSDLPSWSWSETHKSGVYTAETSDGQMTEKFAVNLANYEESEPDRVEISELPSQFQKHSIDGTAESIDTRIDSAPLFRLMLGLLLLLLIAETGVAWYFGNART